MVSENNQSRLEHSLKVLAYLFLLSKMIWVPTTNNLTAGKYLKNHHLGTFAH